MGILAVILAILAVLCAAMGTLLLGIGGVILAVLLAIAAIVLAIMKRRKDNNGGIPAILIAALAIIMAFGMNSTWKSFYQGMHEKAVEYLPDGMIAQLSEDTRFGLLGFLSDLPRDEGSISALVEEFNELTYLTEAEGENAAEEENAAEGETEA